MLQDIQPNVFRLLVDTLIVQLAAEGFKVGSNDWYHYSQ